MSLSASKPLQYLQKVLKGVSFKDNYIAYFCKMFIQAFGQLTFQGSYAVILLLKQNNPTRGCISNVSNE